MAKIYWAIHGYPPRQNAGAEWMAKEINDYLETKEHEIFIHDPARSLEGEIEELNPDIIITHLDLSEAATQLAGKCALPCINIVHHTFGIPHLTASLKNIAVVYNAVWVAESCRYPQPSLIVHPPVNPERFQNVAYNPDGCITLVNCNKDKGALIFQEIARTMPQKQFLAVKGHHGPQINLKAKNLIQYESVDDIVPVLAQTAVLLVPSVYESYGRIAVEALACGIPVVATDTPGLHEAIYNMGYFIKNRNFIPSWIQNIYNADTKDMHQHMAKIRRHYANARWTESLNELENLNNLILELCR